MNNGGPAFPIPYIDGMAIDDSWGMSLRDYFAAKAINLFSFDKEDIEKLQSGVMPMHGLVAKVCYEVADAMLKERNKPSI